MPPPPPGSPLNGHNQGVLCVADPPLHPSRLMQHSYSWGVRVLDNPPTHLG